MTCRPPNGTTDETLHVLKSNLSGREKTFLWRKECWNTPGTVWGTGWAQMTALGWRYKQPAMENTNG